MNTPQPSLRARALLLVAVSLVVLQVSRSSPVSAEASGRPGIGERVLAALLGPVQRAAFRVAESVRGVALALTSPEALARDSAELAVLAQEARGASRVLHERTHLPATDRLPPTDPEIIAQHLAGAVPARVIGADPAGRRGLLLLNRGVTSGIARGMAVVAGPDIVAQVDRANRSTSVACLATDRQFSAPVRVMRTSAYVGSVQGDGKMGLVLHALPSAEDIREGDVLVTAASETGPAAELRVGVVDRVVREGPAAERGGLVRLRVSVRPRATLRHLDTVRVVRGEP